jgi:D-amino peptidase
MQFKNILIIADIEGSSGCWSYSDSSFMTRGWRRACIGMTEDVGSLVAGLFNAGVQHVSVHDFHRTGYNILPERIDPRAKVISGYRLGPVPGVGDPRDAEAVMFLGMHAASGTKGFLAHTFTSRIRRLEVNGKPMPEVEFFAASLAPYGLRPIFFSGCPVACAQARTAIPGIHIFPIDKTAGPDNFEAESWRSDLANAAVKSLGNKSTMPYTPQGPFQAKAIMRDGPKIARKLAQRWGFLHEGDRIYIDTPDIQTLYQNFIRLCYLTPRVEKIIPAGLFLYNLLGRWGLARVRLSLHFSAQ